jgi:hypothetical protein
LKEKELSLTKEVVGGKVLLKMTKKIAFEYDRLLKEVSLEAGGQTVFLLMA